MRGSFLAKALASAGLLLVAGAAHGATQTTPGNMAVNPFAVRAFVSIGCVAQGTPVEFPNDIVLSNKGNVTLAAGTRIQWIMTAPNRSGVYKLTAPLAPGKAVFVANVLGSGVGAGHPCSAKVI